MRPGDVPGGHPARRSPQEIDGAEHEGRHAKVRRDQRRVGSDIRLEQVQRKRDDCRTEPEPFSDPAEEERAERNAQQDDHEARRIQQPIAAVAGVQKPVTDLEGPGKRQDLRAGAIELARVDGRARHPGQRQRRPDAKQRRMLDRRPIVSRGHSGITCSEIAGLVERGGRSPETVNFERNEHDGEDNQYQRHDRGPWPAGCRLPGLRPTLRAHVGAERNPSESRHKKKDPGKRPGIHAIRSDACVRR